MRWARILSSSSPGVGPSGQHDSLQVEGLSVHFKGVRAVDEVDLHLCRGEIFGLIGPNGAGKTTLVNAVSGFQTPTRGTVALAGADVTGWPPRRLARNGLARTFQNVRLFADLSVLENVELAGVATGMRRKPARRWAWELLKRLGLDELASLPASALPHGAERRVGVARALALRPRFLLLDEPAAGLNEGESDQLIAVLKSIRDDFGCALLVIEHDMRVIMRLCERIQVLDYGKTIKVGTPEEVRADSSVRAAYLGTARAASDAPH